MWSDTNKHKLNIILKEIQINTQGDAPPCTSALLRWQWPTPQCGHVWCTRSPHTLLQNGRAAFDVSVNSPKLNIQLSCNLVVPFLLYPRGLKTSVPMNLYYTFTIHISQSLNFKVKKKKKNPTTLTCLVSHGARSEWRNGHYIPCKTMSSDEWRQGGLRTSELLPHLKLAFNVVNKK